MSGFESPNYTQTPNDFFDWLPDMQETEMRVTLVMIRKTFGFHRDEFKMGVTKLAKAAGLSRQGALDGAEAAEKRGTFKRTNPEAITEAEWALVVPLHEVDDPLQPVDIPLHIVEGSPQDNGGQSRVKETIKKKSKERIKDGETPQRKKANAFPELVLFREVTKRYPHEANQEDVISEIQKVANRLGRDVTKDDLIPFFKFWTGKGYNPYGLGWLEWAVKGETPKNGREANVQEPKAFDGVRKFLARHGVSNG